MSALGQPLGPVQLLPATELRAGDRRPAAIDSAMPLIAGPVQAVAATVTGDAATGSGESFRLRPRWPSVAQLEYVSKFATASLLALGLFLLLGHAAKSPGGAARAIAGAARRRVGI